MKRLGIAVIAAICAFVVPALVYAEDSGNHYGQKKNAITSADTLATQWTCNTNFNAGVATISFGIDNLSQLLSDPDTYVTATWSNIILQEDAVDPVVIDQLTLTLKGDPVVELGFAVRAGTADTTFKIVSSLLSFPALTNALADATAAITVTDSTRTRNGATATGLFGGKFFQARYDSNVYGNLIGGPVTAGPGLSNIAQESIGTDTLASVSSMQSEFWFTLSAGDQASGTSSYNTYASVPEPGSLLALLGGVASLVGFARIKR